MGDNKEFIQQKNEIKIKNGERCRIPHGLDLHAAVKDEICQCLRPKIIKKKYIHSYM